MRTYGQYCPIARSAEVFAERWTPIIVRNLLLGCETFTELQKGAPGIPRSLLAQRLTMLERAGIVERHPVERGRGFRYVPTEAGKDLWPVCVAMGEWGARWLEVAPEHLDPYVALWSMCNSLAVDRLPDRRVVVRFEFSDQPKRHARFWLLLEHGTGEVCATSPGEEDLVVVARSEPFVRWHMGHLSWSQAVSDGGVRVEGPPTLARAFPTWNQRSHFAHIRPVSALHSSAG